MTYYTAPGIPGINTDEQKLLVANRKIQAIRIYFSVSESKLMGKGRELEVIKARFWCMWFLKNHFGYSLSAIGRKFGRDHTSVLHAVRAVNDQLEPITGDNDWKRDYEKLVVL